jgi:hypothetical protein
VITDGAQIGQKAMMKDGESGMPGKFQKFFIMLGTGCRMEKKAPGKYSGKKEKCVLTYTKRNLFFLILWFLDFSSASIFFYVQHFGKHRWNGS